MPYPFLYTVRSIGFWASFFATCAPITKSFLSSLIKRTPPALRPISRASDSLNRIDCPSVVTIETVSPLSTNETETSKSSGESLIAIMPLALTSAKLFAETLFPAPSLVTIISDSSAFPFSPFGTGRIEVIFSSLPSEMKFIIDLPRVARFPSGISYILIWYAFPLSVKNKRSL